MKPKLCSDCGCPKHWTPCDEALICWNEDCFEGGGNVRYFNSPAFGQHYNDANGVGLFLSKPPAEFYRYLAERSPEPFTLPLWKWCSLLLIFLSMLGSISLVVFKR